MAGISVNSAQLLFLLSLRHGKLWLALTQCKSPKIVNLAERPGSLCLQARLPLLLEFAQALEVISKQARHIGRG